MTTATMEYRSDMPTISDERLAELVARLRPVSRPASDGTVRFYEPSDPRTEAFMWGGSALTDETARIASPVGKPFRTLHGFSSPSFFRPTLAEVFAQIPADIDLADADAFRIEFQELKVVQPGGGAAGEGRMYHAAEVRLYQVS